MATLNDNYERLVLDNGLVVALQNTPTQTISGRLRVHHGGLHERDGEEGLAHFLEHTVMKGGGRKFAPDAAERIMGTFGYINAHTGSNETRFPVGMLAEDLELYLDFVSDVAFHPRFDLERVNQERQRVLRETADAKGNPAFQDNEDFKDALYGVDSPHTYFVLGKEDVVTRATPDNLRTFHERGYNPNNMDLILVGALPKNVDELVAKYFADKPKGKGAKYHFQKNPELEKKTLLYRNAPELLNGHNFENSSAHFNMGFVAPTDDAEDSYAVGELVQILGGDTNSRLFKKVSQEMGLAYGIRSDYILQNNAGVINISGSVQATRADEVIDATFNEMKRMQENPVSKQELDCFKRKSKYGIAKTFETNEGHINAIETKDDKGLTPEVFLAEIDAVTSADVQRVAQKYLPKDRAQGKYVLMLRNPSKE